MDFLPFKEPGECGIVQLFVLTGMYGYVLFTAANMIGNGSELLLLVPSMAQLVGSIVLPVLGAVPDGMMVMFSGLKANPQEEIAVGVGALAGSTIMLLTIPWFLAIYAGRVNIKKDGGTNYAHPKLDPENYFDWEKTGVSVSSQIRNCGYLMYATLLSYFIVQVPAILLAEKPHQSIAEKAQKVNTYALIGLLTTTAFFIIYLWYQVIQTQTDEKKDQSLHDSKAIAVQTKAIKEGKITLRGVMFGMWGGVTDDAGQQRALQPSASRMMLLSSKEQNRVKQLVRPFFQYYDDNRDHTLQRSEFSKIMKDLNENLNYEEEQKLFDSVDTDQSESIDFDEFAELMVRYSKGDVGRPLNTRSVVKPQKFITMTREDEVDDLDEDEEDEMPDDLLDLTPEEQQKRIKIRSFWLMGIGTATVLIFSDPAVDVLQELGVRSGISPFYISFILAPLASNASELVAATNYGLKKTQRYMTISLSTLLGAACMNNTFCLAIFYCLVYFKDLAWTFTAETLSIILVEVWVGFFAIYSTVHTMKRAGLVLAAYPASILFVYVLENVFGLD